MNTTIIIAIVRKEFYHLIRDFRSLYLAFIIPLLLILMFGYALSLDVDNVKTIIVDHDKTFLSRDFKDKLDASSYFDVFRYSPDADSATKYLDDGRATVVVIIPPGWTRDISADRKGSIQVLLDGSDPNFSGMARGYITSFVERYNRTLLTKFLNRNGMNELKTPVNGRIRVWFNEDLESRDFIVPGIIAIIIMIEGVIMTSLVIAREYENGTMETIRSIPIRANEFFTGKAIPYFFIGVIDVLLAVLIGQVLFGVVIKGSFGLMMLATVIYLWVALSLGLFISVTVKTQLISNQIALMVSYLPALMLSNFVFPIENMPKLLQMITYIVPARYFIDILNGLYLRNLNLSYLWFDFLILTVMSVFLTVITLRKLKKEGL